MLRLVAIFGAVLVALGASPSDARERSHPRRHHSTAESRAAPSRARQTDCPSGDCRGVNSTGGLGGTPGDF